MNSKTLVKLNGMGIIPTPLVINWRRNHIHDPIAAARGVLVLERWGMWSFYATMAGIGIALCVLLLLMVLTPKMPILSEAPKGPWTGLIIMTLFISTVVWVVAFMVSKVVGDCSGLDALKRELHETVYAFDGRLSELEIAFGLDKPLGALAKMDEAGLKALAEKLLVARAKEVLHAEEKTGKGKFPDPDAQYEKLNRVNAFKSLYSTLSVFGLVTGKYERFYKLAQKALKEERPLRA